MGDSGRGHNGVVMSEAPVRTLSCTKEEVDEILIQCGRLSRSSFRRLGRASVLQEKSSLVRSGAMISVTPQTRGVH